MSAPSSPVLFNLSDELLSRILQFVDAFTLSKSVGPVCKKLYAASQDQAVWEVLYNDLLDYHKGLERIAPEAADAENGKEEEDVERPAKRMRIDYKEKFLREYLSSVYLSHVDFTSWLKGKNSLFVNITNHIINFFRKNYAFLTTDKTQRKISNIPFDSVRRIVIGDDRHDTLTMAYYDIDSIAAYYSSKSPAEKNWDNASILEDVSAAMSAIKFPIEEAWKTQFAKYLSQYFRLVFPYVQSLAFTDFYTPDYNNMDTIGHFLHSFPYLRLVTCTGMSDPVTDRLLHHINSYAKFIEYLEVTDPETENSARGGTQNITDTGLKQLVEECVSLTNVVLHMCSDLQGTFLPLMLENCGDLVKLEILTYNPVTQVVGGAGTHVILGPEIEPLDNLKTFNTDLLCIDEAFVKRLLELAPNIKTITLSADCPAATEETGKKLIEQCKERKIKLAFKKNGEMYKKADWLKSREAEKEDEAFSVDKEHEEEEEDDGADEADE